MVNGMLKPRHPREGRAVVPAIRHVVLVSESQRARVKTPIQAWTAADHFSRSLVTTKAYDWWITDALPGQPAWIVASRVIGDDVGRPVVAEVRVFPNVKGATEDDCGEWSAECLGYEARPIPRGGISASLLRSHIAKMIGLHQQAAIVLAHTPRIRFPAGERERQAGFDDFEAARERAGIRYVNPFAALEAKQRKTRSGPGRPTEWEEGDLARIGIVYDDAVRAGKRPVVAVAQAEGISGSQARNLVLKARKRNLLSRQTGAGRVALRLESKDRRRIQKLSRPKSAQKMARKR